jgi:hypothetical protein
MRHECQSDFGLRWKQKTLKIKKEKGMMDEGETGYKKLKLRYIGKNDVK